MSESCIVDINFKTQKSKIKFDNDKNESSLTVDLGKYLNTIYEDSIFLIEFELGEIRFSINEADVHKRMNNIFEIIKNFKEN